MGGEVVKLGEGGWGWGRNKIGRRAGGGGKGELVVQGDGV